MGVRSRASTRCRVPIILLAFVLLFTSNLTSARAGFPGGNGRIVFTSHRGHQFGIFTMRPNGGSIRYVGQGFRPAWSPDGGRIAFVGLLDVAVSHFNQIYTVGPNGESPTRLTLMRGVNADTPAWSPDGRHIVFAADHIYTMNADGSHLHQVTHQATDGVEPAWSPDGTRIALNRGDRIETVNLNGHDLRPVTPESMLAYEPAWSPDGGLIAFVSSDEQSPTRWSLFTIHPDGSGLRLLVQTSRNDESLTSPSWSPDGDWIAYVITRHFYEQNDTRSDLIFKIHPDGTYRQQLSTDASTIDNDPDWGPVPASHRIRSDFVPTSECSIPVRSRRY